MRYLYTGTTEVSIPALGVIKPHEIVVTNIKINNPNFVEVKKEKQKKGKKNY